MLLKEMQPRTMKVIWQVMLLLACGSEQESVSNSDFWLPQLLAVAAADVDVAADAGFKTSSTGLQKHSCELDQPTILFSLIALVKRILEDKQYIISAVCDLQKHLSLACRCSGFSYAVKRNATKKNEGYLAGHAFAGY